jgi:hypothetical protein
MISRDPIDIFSSNYRDARIAGLPVFRGPIEQATPLDASPYVVEFSEFMKDFGYSPFRSELLQSLIGGLASMVPVGAVPHLAMIGGSFVDLDLPEPRDLDGAIFYARSQTCPLNASRLRILQQDLLERRIDIRFMPIDHSLAFLAKTIGFFTLLYTQQREGGARRATLLIDLTRLHDEAEKA